MAINESQATIDFNRVAEAIVFLEKNFMQQPSLTEVAQQVNVSEHHFQRIFTEWAGISPKRFLQFLTVDFLKTRLQQSRSIEEAASMAGLSSQSRVYDLFTTLEAVTPEEYKKNGQGVLIQYGIHATPFGRCLIGVSTRGVCWLSFVADSHEADALDEMKNHWRYSEIIENQRESLTYINQIFFNRSVDKPLSVFVKGTNFQIKVWKALLRIPPGGVTTYQDIAAQIENPKALQAVGSAVGSNHIAYLIPCHRVIRKDGILGEYRWDPIRKKGMIGFEMAFAEKPGS